MEAPGKLVPVNDTQLHVYRAPRKTERAGASIVLLSGWGTPCPTYDFKPLWSLLASRYDVAVVERPGYGWSGRTKRPRDIATMSDETRSALREAGMPGPFAVAAHSISGLEALHWAQLYPDEVSAIIGLDMAVPQVYESMKVPRSLPLLARLARLLRAPLASCISKGNPAVKAGLLDREEQAAMRAVIADQALNENVVEEASCVKDNARTVTEAACPATRALCILSDDGSMRRQIPAWGQAHRAYFASSDKAEFLELPCGHYVHGAMPLDVARAIEGFLG